MKYLHQSLLSIKSLTLTIKMHMKRFWHQGTCVYLYLLILWHYTKLTVAHMSSYTIFTKTVASIASKASLRGNQYYSHHYIFAIAFLLLASCIYTHATNLTVNLCDNVTCLN